MKTIKKSIIKKTAKETKKPVTTDSKQEKIVKQDFQFISTPAELTKCCKELSKVKKFAIDIECENGLHHYGTYVCLIQISTKTQHYIIDPLKFKTRKELLPLIKILEDENIQKILHDYSFDLRIIYSQYNSRPKNIFDTQMACLLIGREKLGLASLLEEFCSIKAEKKFQRYDWTRRPLADNMLAYAIGDTNNLIFIQEKLIKELKDKKRLEWCKEENKEIENKKLSYNEQTFYDIKGIRQLSNNERAILLRLWRLRDSIAKNNDKPLHYVLGTKMMMELVKDPPKGDKGWKYLKGASRYIKSDPEQFSEAVKKAKNEEIMVAPKPRMRMTSEQKKAYEKLEEKRNKIAEKLKIRAHLIASNDQLLDITLTKKKDSLRAWQKKLLE